MKCSRIPAMPHSLILSWYKNPNNCLFPPALVWFFPGLLPFLLALRGGGCTNMREHQTICGMDYLQDKPLKPFIPLEAVSHPESQNILTVPSP